MSRILIAGGGGLLGQALAEYFASIRQDVLILSRNAAPAGFSPHIRYIRWAGVPTDNPEPWESQLAGATALINLAGRSVNCRYTSANRRHILDSRILSTRALAVAMARCPVPPPVWLNSSTATIYKHTFGSAQDDAGVIGQTPEANDAFSLRVATTWEEEFFQSASSARRIALRTAIVLSNRPGNMIPILRRLVRLGFGGRMGDGRQWVSWIHERDFCRAVDFIITHDALVGTVNLAAPHPITNAQMMAEVRAALGRRFGLPATRWMLALGAFFLRTEPELVLKSRRVIASRLPAAGFTFEFADFRAALADLNKLCQPA